MILILLMLAVLGCISLSVGWTALNKHNKWIPIVHKKKVVYLGNVKYCPRNGHFYYFIRGSWQKIQRKNK